MNNEDPNAAFISGKMDAELGESPTSPGNDDYMIGYLWGIRNSLKQGWNLQIRWLSPSYLNGAYDTTTTGEF
jgi:hypothetical protein